MEVKKWEIVSSEYKLRSPWVNVRRDVCRLPTGVINPEYYIFELPTWVNIIAITREGKFVMVEQYRHGLRDVYTEIVGGAMGKGRLTWRLPGGNCLRNPATATERGASL